LCFKKKSVHRVIWLQEGELSQKNGGGGGAKCLFADFHSKMSVCRHKLEEGGSTPNPSPTIPTLLLDLVYLGLPIRNGLRTTGSVATGYQMVTRWRYVTRNVPYGQISWRQLGFLF